MNYEVYPPIYASSDDTLMRVQSAAKFSPGDLELTPWAIQWKLVLDISINGTGAPFEFVENVVRGFASSHILREWSELQYEQIDNGLLAVFGCESSKGTASSSIYSASKRQELQHVSASVEFFTDFTAGEAMFPSAVRLLDYGLTCIFATYSCIAPAVFTNAKQRLITIEPLLRPLKLAFGPGTERQLNIIAERGLLASCQPSTTSHNPRPHDLGTKADTMKEAKLMWHGPGRFIGPISYSHRRFVLLGDDEDNSREDIHEPIFVRPLIESLRKRRRKLIN